MRRGVVELQAYTRRWRAAGTSSIGNTLDRRGCSREPDEALGRHLAMGFSG